VPEIPLFDFPAILRALASRHVDFLVVGGVGAVLHGAPVATFDLDIVHSRQPANVDRLLAALKDLDAFYRLQPHRHIRPTVSYLSAPGHQLLRTRFGSLDVLGSVGRYAYEELHAYSTEIELEKEVRVRLLNLDWIIRLKEEANADKDRAVLPILRRTLEEKSRS